MTYYPSSTGKETNVREVTHLPADKGGGCHQQSLHCQKHKHTVSVPTHLIQPHAASDAALCQAGAHVNSHRSQVGVRGVQAQVQQRTLNLQATRQHISHSRMCKEQKSA